MSADSEVVAQGEDNQEEQYRAEKRVKTTPVIMAPEALDLSHLIRAGETIGWAEATAEPIILTRMLDAQTERCAHFRVFFALTFSEAFAAGHPNVTVIALGGAAPGGVFFRGRR